MEYIYSCSLGRKVIERVGINILSLSDTIGSSTPKVISWLFKKLIKEFPDVEFGAHLHSSPDNYLENFNLHMMQVVKDLTVLFLVLVDVQWQRTIY